MYNLRVVVSFELARTFRRLGFWVASLLVPVMICAALAVMYLSNSASSDDETEPVTGVEFAYVDESGIVDADIAAAMGGRSAQPGEDVIEAVREGRLDAVVEVPADPTNAEVRVAAQDRGVFDNGVYTQLAQALVAQSVTAQLDDPALAPLATGAVTVAATTYADSVAADGITRLLLPLVVLVAFYLMIFMLANHMMNATVEEKENRIAETILTALTPTTLLVGKVMALVMIGLVQVVLLLVPVVAAFVLCREQLRLPNIDLSALVVEADVLAIGVAMLIGGFAVFMTTLLAAGAMLPTTKDAGSIFGAMIAVLFVPFWVVTMIASGSSSPVVDLFTYFPYTSAVTAMLRNAFGTLDPATTAIVLVIQVPIAATLFAIAVRAFRTGAIDYSRSLLRRRV